MNTEQIKTMTMEEIREQFRQAAALQANGQEISWERGAALVTIIGVHGWRIAERLTN